MPFSTISGDKGLQAHACAVTPPQVQRYRHNPEPVVLLQNFVSTNSWESYTSNAVSTIHLYDHHDCDGECASFLPANGTAPEELVAQSYGVRNRLSS